MPSPLPIPPKILAALALVALAGCQPNTPRPVPSVPQIGADLKCAQGDHPFEDAQAGWGFCYPGDWKYHERSQSSSSPPGLDLAFDITNDPATPQPCVVPSAVPSGQPMPTSSPCSGAFAFMIISTYERGSSPDLQSWIAANLKPAQGMTPISWGNAIEAVQLADGRRVALTPHHVVILDLHSGLLDLETEMGARLNSWKFSF
jgi:hypothetical protein